MKKLAQYLWVLVFTCSCAVMHRVQVSEIEPRLPTSHPIDVKASEVGFDIEGAGRLSSRALKRRGNGNAKTVSEWIDFLIWATTWAPKTGNATVTDVWADNLVSGLQAECPNGKVSNIQLVRESAQYPLVSGEIVRVRAICYEKGETAAIRGRK